jgi:2-polyprenyl-6-methoxyphenol hydroxylase-like FAD-dependent oxidoreductase
MDADVIIAGAGPTGLMLAGELRLARVRPLVLERRPRPREVEKAGGLGGQILQLLHYRGLLERFKEASIDPSPAPKFPWGGVHLDLTTWRIPRCTRYSSRNRGSSACSPNAPRSSAPISAAGTR